MNPLDRYPLFNSQAMSEFSMKLIEVVSELKSFDSSPHSNYNKEDASDLYEKKRMYIEGIQQLIYLHEILHEIDLNYLDGKRLSSYRYDRMEGIHKKFREIASRCKELYTEYQESVFDAKTLVETTIALIKSPLGDLYRHQVIPILLNRCKEAIQNGFQHLLCSKEMIQRENQKKKWVCPICHEPDRKGVVWLVSEEKNEHGKEACSHSFHQKCFLDGYKYSSKCAICRRNIVSFTGYCVNDDRVF